MRQKFHAIALGLSLFASLAQAEIPSVAARVILAGDVFGRNSAYFSGRDNVASVVSKGTEAKILETRKFRSGKYALKVRIEKTPEQSKNRRGFAKKDQEVWVYYDPKKPWIRLESQTHETVKTPELAVRATARRDIAVLASAHSAPSHSVPFAPSHSTSTPSGRSRSARSAQPTKIVSRVADPGPIRIVELAQTATETTPEGDVSCEPTGATEPTEKPDSFRLNGLSATAAWSEHPEIMTYSTSPTLSKALDVAVRKASPVFTGWCYRSVKGILKKAELVESRPAGGDAVDAMNDLKKAGFTNLLEDPRYKDKISAPADAPKGAVIVYSTTRHNSGHIEFKTAFGSDGGYVSDYFSRYPVNGNPNSGEVSRSFKMIGVFVKLEQGA